MDFDSAAQPASPVVLTVPHAGRDYPARFATMVRLTGTQLLALEDRHADRLVDHARDRGFLTLVARTPRCWIDLNRDPRDIDPALTPLPPGVAPGKGPKVRAGLGLVPRKLARHGDIWRAPVRLDDILERIETIHHPWHRAIEVALGRAHMQFGGAVLMDVHSMPSLAGHGSAEIVIGDLFGRSSSSQMTQLAVDAARRHGFRTAQNAPYAGGYVLDRHGQPARNIHAVQIEVDRALYLDSSWNNPSQGLIRVQQFIAELAAIYDSEIRPLTAIAAE